MMATRSNLVPKWLEYVQSLPPSENIKTAAKVVLKPLIEERLLKALGKMNKASSRRSTASQLKFCGFG